MNFYTGIISLSTLSNVQHIQHIYVSGNIYLFYFEGDSNSHKHSFYLRNDVAANTEFAGRLDVERHSSLLSPVTYK